MSDITKDEFIDKYGEIIVQFRSYYKYSFTYEGELKNGDSIMARIGGDSDDIYRIEVVNNETSTIASLDPISAGIYRDGSEICGFYDY